MILEILANTTDKISIGACDENTKFAFQIARLVIQILQIAVPFALIIWGSLDFFKAVIAGDDKEMKQKRKPFIQRVVAAIIVLLLPMLVDIIMSNIAKDHEGSFASCWQNADPKNGIVLPQYNSVVK